MENYYARLGVISSNVGWPQLLNDGLGSAVFHLTLVETAPVATRDAVRTELSLQEMRTEMLRFLELLIPPLLARVATGEEVTTECSRTLRLGVRLPLLAAEAALVATAKARKALGWLVVPELATTTETGVGVVDAETAEGVHSAEKAVVLSSSASKLARAS